MFNDNFNVFLEFVSCMNKYIEVLYVCAINNHVCTIDLILNSETPPAVLPFPNSAETPKLCFGPFSKWGGTSRWRSIVLCCCVVLSMHTYAMCGGFAGQKCLFFIASYC